MINILILEKIKDYLRSRAPKLFSSTETYSQTGEDLIVKNALRMIKGKGPFRYLDIGANDPYRLSNTALLFKEGSSGVLVEPNPRVVKRLKKMRGQRDKIIECGVEFSNKKKAEFYLIDPDVLSTFSKEEANKFKKNGFNFKNIIYVDLKNVNEILETAGEIDFMSLDAEGLDFDILKNINWNIYRPTCICVETVSFETINEPIKNQELINYMISNDYKVHADTFINTIFIDNIVWKEKFGLKID